MPGIVTFCAQQEAFKPGSGHFTYIYDLSAKRQQTIKRKFDYLQERPVRFFQTAKLTIGCAMRDDCAHVLLIQVIDPNEKLTA